MTVTVTLKGDKELQRKLSRLKPKEKIAIVKNAEHHVTKM